ncbi:hypothetical protein BFJ65_g18730 [Fusarium oxysporum f. sp. cepae]|uniref:Uncharacterized protein n=1 Tax=Fusarium oxysporum f. sp. cepae TaxID=396571 RepID=A0A3L6MNQ9_FUSOX|nr:hypothetical protein BFJ65_g18730 [Fusarium oxysporum f. sp. cepae]
MTSTDSSATTPSSSSVARLGPSFNPIKRVPKSTSYETISKIIKDDGAVVINEYMTAQQVRNFNSELDPTIAAMDTCGELNLPEEFKAFQGHQTKRLCNLTTLSRTWREELLDDDFMHGVCDEVLKKNIGDYWMSTAQLIEIGPGNVQQPLHRDAGNWWPFYVMGPAGPTCYLNFLMALTDTTVENGATRFIPGSNKWSYTADWPNTGSDDWTLPVELKAGDVLVIDDRIVHGGGANKTKDFHRRVVSVAITSSVFTQEEANSLVIKPELAKNLPERVKRFLGFRSQYPQGSPGLWSFNTEDIGKVLGY